MYNAIILKDKEKDKKLVFFAIARHLLKSKEGLLLPLIVRGKVGANCKKKLSIWGGLNIKRDMNM